MRTGPRPFSAHLGMMASALSAAGQTDDGQFADVMKNVLLGVQRYQQHQTPPRRLPLETVWQEGSVSLCSLHSTIPRDDRPVLLLVPSMVNRAYILDLVAERSLLRWLEGQGIVTLLLDWGDPVTDAALVDVENVILKRLMPAARYAAEQSGRPIHVLGYCMGGTMLAGAAQGLREDIKSMVFLAAPWDFHAGTKALQERIQFWLPAATPLMAERGMLPMDWIQTVFASIDPAATAQKFTDFGRLDPASPEAEIFVAVEDWLNDGVDLPVGVAREPIEEWFIKNKPFRGEWILGGNSVNPAQISCPSLMIASRKDKLVEYDCAQALQALIPGSEIIDTGCGHIGMMAGRRAREAVWQPLAAWVKKHD
jgi:polyhydroxyalkanoate synthase